MKDNLNTKVSKKQQLVMGKNKTNIFQNDTERLLELKTCLEKAHEILFYERDVDKSRTLIRDVLSRYNENKKYITANTVTEGPFEFLSE